MGGGKNGLQQDTRLRIIIKMGGILDRLKEEKYQRIIILVFRIGLGVLFVYASLDKIWNPGLFAKNIANYRILPLPLLHITAIILPWLELLCGLALIINRFKRTANILIGSMLLFFTLAIFSAMARGLDINCGCFDQKSDVVNLSSVKILENLGMLTISGILENRFRRNQSCI